MKNCIFLFLLMYSNSGLLSACSLRSGTESEFFSVTEALKKKDIAKTLTLTVAPSAEEIKRLPELKVLENLFVYYHTNTLPVEFAALTTLKTLEVHSRLSSFPVQLKSLVRLNRVVIYPGEEATDSFFTVAAEWKELNYLDVDDAGLKKLPVALAQCDHIKVLVLRNSKFTEMPRVLSELASLQNIYIGLDADYKGGDVELPALNTVTVAVQNENSLNLFLQSLKSGRAKLKSLEVSVEKSSKPFQMPAVASEFELLKILKISADQPGVLGKGLFRQMKKNMEIETLLLNNCDSVPADIEQLASLTTISIRGYSVFLSETMNVSRLKSFSVTANRVNSLKCISLPGSLEQLEVLLGDGANDLPALLSVIPASKELKKIIVSRETGSRNFQVIQKMFPAVVVSYSDRFSSEQTY